MKYENPAASAADTHEQRTPFWEKVYDGVKERIDTASGVIKWLFDDAVKTGRRHNLEFVNMGKKAPLGNRIKFFCIVIPSII